MKLSLFLIDEWLSNCYFKIMESAFEKGAAVAD